LQKSELEDIAEELELEDIAENLYDRIELEEFEKLETAGKPL